MYDDMNTAQLAQEKSYTWLPAPVGGNPVRETRRQRLMRSKAQIQAQLSAVQKALDALDSHPELEEFIETLANAGA